MGDQAVACPARNRRQRRHLVRLDPLPRGEQEAGLASLAVEQVHLPRVTVAVDVHQHAVAVLGDAAERHHLARESLDQPGEQRGFRMIGGDEIPVRRSEEHTSELQSLMRISYAVFCLKKKKIYTTV